MKIKIRFCFHIVYVRVYVKIIYRFMSFLETKKWKDEFWEKCQKPYLQNGPNYYTIGMELERFAWYLFYVCTQQR